MPDIYLNQFIIGESFLEKDKMFIFSEEQDGWRRHSLGIFLIVFKSLQNYRSCLAPPCNTLLMVTSPHVMGRREQQCQDFLFSIGLLLRFSTANANWKEKMTVASSQQSSKNWAETTSRLQVGWDIYKLIAHLSRSHATAEFFLSTFWVTINHEFLIELWK